MADYQSVDGRNGIRETGANLDRGSVVSTLFRSESKGKGDRVQNVVQSSRSRTSSQKSLNGKLKWPSEENGSAEMV